jgi:hypothetical protein
MLIVGSVIIGRRDEGGEPKDDSSFSDEKLPGVQIQDVAESIGRETLSNARKRK